MKRFFAFQTANDSVVSLAGNFIKGRTINIDSITIPPFKNIQANFGNTISYNIGSGDVNLTIPEGFYTSSNDLISQVQTVLQASDPNFTCTIANYTLIVTISHATTNFSMSGDFLKYYLGFGVMPDGTTNTYNSQYSAKLYPMNGFGCNISCIKSDVVGLDRKYSLVLLADTFSFSDNKNYSFSKMDYESVAGEYNLFANFIDDFAVQIYALFPDKTSYLIDFGNCSIGGLLVIT